MKMIATAVSKFVAVLAVLGSFALTEGLSAETQPSRAVVIGILGSATYSTGGEASAPLRVGAVLNSGAVIRTGPRSAVDLHLGKLVGVLRLAEDSTLVLDKLAKTEPGAETAMEIELSLPEGTLLGNPNKLPATAKFQVKIPGGIAGIDSGQFRIQSQGFVVLTSGALIFVQIPPSGEPVPYTMKAPPAIYYSPFEQIKPAPPVLVREVVGQTKSKLPQH